MKFLVCIFFIFSSFSATAANNCEQLNALRLKMNVHASNWQNAKTTRTPEGGAYKYKVVDCTSICKIIEINKNILKYQPGHPDADINGYVEYPNVNTIDEKNIALTYIFNYLNEPFSCPTIKKISVEDHLIVVSYQDKGIISRDTFSIEPLTKKLNFWSTEYVDGKNRVLYF